MKIFSNKNDLLIWSCKQCKSDKFAALEFGVYTGHSISIIRSYYNGSVYGFDSFNGLPEFWRDGYSEGHFKTDHIPSIDQVDIVVGLFQDTLEQFLLSLNKEIDFVHFDADLYSSTIFCLNKIKNYLHKETIFLFDEYQNYPDWESHEHKAFMEWLEENPDVSAKRIAEVRNNEQVAFKVTISTKQ